MKRGGHAMESNDSRRAAGTLVLLVADRNDSEGGRGGGGGFKAPSESYPSKDHDSNDV